MSDRTKVQELGLPRIDSEFHKSNNSGRLVYSSAYIDIRQTDELFLILDRQAKTVVKIQYDHMPEIMMAICNVHDDIDAVLVSRKHS
jgi:hypothetical protein